MAALEFNDGVLTELRSPFPVPADRFLNWLPDGEPIGPARVAPANGRTHRWEFRKERSTSFIVQGLTEAQHAVAIRLKIHMLNGGAVTVKTEDAAARVYTCYLKPETVPTIAGPDDTWEFTFSVAVINSDPAVPLLCIY